MRSCLARLAFTAVVVSALGTFSNRWMRENYFTAAAVELLSDRVPNVRLAACALLPRLKSTCRVAEDKKLLETMTSALVKLRGDEDKDVAAAAAAAALEFSNVLTAGSGGKGSFFHATPRF